MLLKSIFFKLQWWGCHKDGWKTNALVVKVLKIKWKTKKTERHWIILHFAVLRKNARYSQQIYTSWLCVFPLSVVTHSPTFSEKNLRQAKEIWDIAKINKIWSFLEQKWCYIWELNTCQDFRKNNRNQSFVQPFFLGLFLYCIVYRYLYSTSHCVSQTEALSVHFGSREKVRLKARDQERGAERINEQKGGGRWFQISSYMRLNPQTPFLLSGMATAVSGGI